MNESFCGKLCEHCAWREGLRCSGCKNGPGGRGGSCEIAVCCREKGHAACVTCGFQLNCRLLQAKEEVPQRRQYVQEARAARKRWHDENAPMLGKWLWLLFWLVIPNFIANILTKDAVLEWLPALRVPGEILRLLCGVAYAFFLWQLRDLEKQYRTAAICLLVSAVMNTLGTLLMDNESTGRMVLSGVILLPALMASLYGAYLEYRAHGAVLDGLDDELAEKWRKLWKWEAGLLLGLFGCIIVTVISAVLGLLALIADVIGLAVVGILKLVYLYRTAQLFRKYSVPERVGLPDETIV